MFRRARHKTSLASGGEIYSCPWPTSLRSKPRERWLRSRSRSFGSLRRTWSSDRWTPRMGFMTWRRRRRKLRGTRTFSNNTLQRKCRRKARMLSMKELRLNMKIERIKRLLIQLTVCQSSRRENGGYGD